MNQKGDSMIKINTLSKINCNSYKRLTFKGNKTNIDQKVSNKKIDNTKKKTIITTALIASGVAAAGIYFITKKSKAAQQVTNAVKKIPKSDKLSYEIKPPKIDDIKAPKSLEEYAEFPLEAEYDKIKIDITRNKNTQKRYKEAGEYVAQAYDECVQKTNLIKEGKPYDKTEPFSLTNEDFNRNPLIQRGIPQKRYFSLEGNKQEGYCGLDPLLYKEAREEIVDTYFGYNLLSDIYLPEIFGEKRNPKALNPLIEKLTLSEENTKFINECIEKAARENAVCSGHNSVLHAFELAHVGKIFREALGITVK